MMNTLIEDATTLEYMTSSSQWTKNADAGKDFGATAIAYAAAGQEPIDKFNIVGYFPKSKQFINLVIGQGKGIPKVSAV
jgi:hypothetical protein